MSTAWILVGQARAQHMNTAYALTLIQSWPLGNRCLQVLQGIGFPCEIFAVFFNKAEHRLHRAHAQVQVAIFYEPSSIDVCVHVCIGARLLSPCPSLTVKDSEGDRNACCGKQQCMWLSCSPCQVLQSYYLEKQKASQKKLRGCRQQILQGMHATNTTVSFGADTFLCCKCQFALLVCCPPPPSFGTFLGSSKTSPWIRQHTPCLCIHGIRQFIPLLQLCVLLWQFIPGQFLQPSQLVHAADLCRLAETCSQVSV